MAQFHGKDGLVKISTNTVAEVKSWSFSRTAETYQTNEPTLSDVAPALTYTSGATSGTGSVECLWDDTDTTGQESLDVGSTVSLVLYPEGATTGDFTYSFSAVITGVDIGASFDGMTTRTFNFQISGTVTEGTAA